MRGVDCLFIYTITTLFLSLCFVDESSRFVEVFLSLLLVFGVLYGTVTVSRRTPFPA